MKTNMLLRHYKNSRRKTTMSRFQLGTEKRMKRGRPLGSWMKKINKKNKTRKGMSEEDVPYKDECRREITL